MRAFVELWDEICRERYGVTDPKHRLFRYGVQVNSLGLTEQQPENNVYRILLEMLAVTLSKKARARAVQLPAWNEALGLPRPWDQQWSLRMQQILAYETDLLEYGDIFDGSTEIDAQGRGAEGRGAAPSWPASRRMGGAVAAIDYMKRRLVESNTARLRRHRDRRAGRRRRQPLDRDRALAAVGRRRRASMTVDPARRGRADRAAAGLARGARRQGRRGRRWPISKRAAQRRPQHHGAVDRRAPRPASPPANGARRCATCSASTARRPASRQRGHRRRRRGSTRCAPQVEAVSDGARPPAQVPGRQARPRRPLQRRRADRRARPRLRHGGGLRGHPPDARRRSCARRSTRACTSSACRSCRARTCRWCAR